MRAHVKFGDVDLKKRVRITTTEGHCVCGLVVAMGYGKIKVLRHNNNATATIKTEHIASIEPFSEERHQIVREHIALTAGDRVSLELKTGELIESVIFWEHDEVYSYFKLGNRVVSIDKADIELYKL